MIATSVNCNYSKFSAVALTFALLLANNSVVVKAWPRPATIPDWTCSGPFDCPAGMWCFTNPVDKKQKYCDCASLSGLARKAPTPDMPLYLENVDQHAVCENNPWTSLFVFFFMAMPTYWSIRVMSDCLYIISCLKKEKAWTNNVAGRTLILVFLLAASVIIALISYLTSMGNIDPSAWILDHIRPLAIAMAAATFAVMQLEVLVVWIDLVQKAATLSRTTTRTLMLAKYFIRAVNVMYCFVTAVAFFIGKGAVVVPLHPLMSVGSLVIVNFTGRSLRKTLCPDPNEKSHPNYLAAESIKLLYTDLTKALPFVFIWQISYFFFENARSMGPAIWVTVMGWMTSGGVSGNVWLRYVKVRNPY